MNNSLLLPNFWRFLLIALVQMLLFKQVSLLVGPYFIIMLWPLCILFLPIELGTPFAVLLGFGLGLMVDMAYASPGLHASAGAFSAYARSFILKAFEPKGGFSGKESIPAPAYFGWPFFLQVAGIFFFLHLFWYFSVDAFTFYYFGTITLKTLAGWGLTMVFVVLYVFLFNPKN